MPRRLQQRGRFQGVSLPSAVEAFKELSHHADMPQRLPDFCLKSVRAFFLAVFPCLFTNQVFIEVLVLRWRALTATAGQ